MFPIKRIATEAEILRYTQIKHKKCSNNYNLCPISDCNDESAVGKGACPQHMKEFLEQREDGVEDYRLWALWKNGEYPKLDAFSIYDWLRSQDDT